MKSNLAIVTGVLAALLLASQARALSTDPAAYAIVGENGVSMNSYSTCLGDIYSGGDLSLQYGYGIQNSPNALTPKTGRAVKVYNRALNHCAGGNRDGQATESQAI